MATDTIEGCLAVIAEASEVERKLHTLFGSDDWCYLRVEDMTGTPWAMEGDSVWWILNDDERPDESGSNYTDPGIYRGIVHRAEGFVLVGVDSQCGGDPTMTIFTESLRIIDRESMAIFAGDDDWEPPHDWPTGDMKDST